MPSKHQAKLILLLALAMLIPPPLSIDEYTPSLPAMVDSLNTTNMMMQLSITLYMLSFALSQIFLGPLSDRFGRRKTTIWSLPIFFIGTALCAFAPTFHFLMIGRFIQGLGIGGCNMNASAILADSFEGAELNRATAYYSLTYSFVPIVSPLIGGYLQDFFGWRANFAFIFIFTALIYLLILFKLPETHTPDESHKLSVKNILQQFKSVLSSGAYLMSVLIMLLCWSMIISFSIIGPFLFQNVYGFSASQYGWLALLIGIGLLIGNYLNTQLLKRLPSKKIIELGLAVCLFGSFAMMCVVMLGFANAWTLLSCIMVVMIGSGWVFPNTYAVAASAVPEAKGVANALIGTLILIGAVIITAAISAMHAHSAHTLWIVFVGLNVATLIAYLANPKKSVV